MKTNMFKKFTKEERRNKMERILRKKTNQTITDEMIDSIFSNVDMSNQLYINFYDRVEKFEKACILECEDKVDSSIIRVEEKPETIYGDIKYVGYDNKVLYDYMKPQIVLKHKKKLYSNQTTEWDYILLIYIPENK